MKKSRSLPWPILLLLSILLLLLFLSARLSVSNLPTYSSSLRKSTSTLIDWLSNPSNESTLEFDYYVDYNDNNEILEEDEEERQEYQAEELPLGNSSFIPKEDEEQIPAVPRDVNDTYNTTNERLTPNGTAGSNENIREHDHEEEEDTKGCDLYSGSWVRDESYPLFQPFVCPFTDTAFQCQENGRKDSGYLHWRWQPSGCNLPRFNATDMLRMLRNRRVVFVGDSLGRNQWESLVCMLYQGVANRSRVFEARSQRVSKTRPSFSVQFVDYKTQIDFYRSHFLVVENNRRLVGGNKRIKCALVLDKLEKSVSKWKDSDIMVFNTGHWWSHNKVKHGKCYFVEKGNFTTSMNVFTAYEKALRTWASWVDSHATKHVFFRGLAPSHFSGGEWDTGGRCEMHTQPLEDESKLDEFPKEVKVVEEVLKSMKTRVTFLNVTKLSLYRKDGHVAGWGRPQGNGRQDCSHWCLPGVPDTWNHLLYASLVQRQL